MLRSLTQFPFKLTLGSRVEDKSRPNSHPCATLFLLRLCMQNMENYMQRLAELVLTGMGSEVLSCCISSTAICVEVRHPAPGGGEGCQWAVGNCLWAS